MEVRSSTPEAGVDSRTLAVAADTNIVAPAARRRRPLEEVGSRVPGVVQLEPLLRVAGKRTAPLQVDSRTPVLAEGI